MQEHKFTSYGVFHKIQITPISYITSSNSYKHDKELFFRKILTLDVRKSTKSNVALYNNKLPLARNLTHCTYFSYVETCLTMFNHRLCLILYMEPVLVICKTKSLTS